MTLDTIALVLAAAGCCALGYGLYKARKLADILQTGQLKQAWDVLSGLIGVFILAYVAYLGHLAGFFLQGLQMSSSAALLVSSVFFLGGVFVAATTRLNTQVFE